jgi:hypothetical protein
VEDSDTPWEPPLAGSETEHLLGALDRLRTTFRWKADGLDEDALRGSVGSSSLTLGSLLKHLALVEDHSSTMRLDGARIGEPWATDWQPGDWIFRSAAGDPADVLYRLWDEAVERSRARFADAIAGGGLDQAVNITWADGRHPSLRRLLFDLVEEYGRHTGHADLLREAIDGRVGEDQPPGWRPTPAR